MILENVKVQRVFLLIMILAGGIGFRLVVFSQTTHVASSGYSSYMKGTLNYSRSAKVINNQEGEWRDSTELFRKLFVLEGGEIDYGELWSQLEKSNHPPLYYLILHTVIGLSGAKKASLLLGFIINLVVSCFTLVVVYFLGQNIFRDNRIALLAAFLFAASFLAMEVFVIHKAYEMQVLLVSLVFLLVFRLFDKDKAGIIDFVFYGAACALAFLAHYYSYLYIAGICLIIFIHYTWIDRKLGRIVLFAISTITAAAVACLVYPATVRDLLLDFRAREIQEKISEPGSFIFEKLYTESFIFLRWFVARPFLFIVVSTVVFVIAGIILRKREVRVMRLIKNEKYVYMLIYFAVCYCAFFYISPFDNLRYVAPLLPLFILLLVGLFRLIPLKFQNAFICFFVLYTFMFNSYSLSRVVRHELSGDYLIKSWKTQNVLTGIDENSSVVLVSIKPREKLRQLFFHAPPREIAYCAAGIPEEFFSRQGEMIVFIDRKMAREKVAEFRELVESKGFERFSHYAGFLVFRRNNPGPE